MKGKRRKRSKATKTTGIVRYTEQDARGVCDPLCRYGDLPTNLLGDLYNAINGNKPQSLSYKDRFTRLFHEADGFTAKRKLVYRPEYQGRRGQNAKAKYRPTIGTAFHAFARGVYTQDQLEWITRTQIVKFEYGRDYAPSDHDEELAVIAAHLEVAFRRNHAFISHLDILKHASPAAQAAESPLAFPIPELRFHFLGQPQPTVNKNTSVTPDALMGCVYEGNRPIFYPLEFDRSTEPGMPKNDLSRKSLLRMVLSYDAIAKGEVPIYKSYMRMTNMLVLVVFWSRKRQEHFLELVRKYATARPGQFLTTVIPPIDAVNAPRLAKDIYRKPWLRADGSLFSIETGREVMRIGDRPDTRASERAHRAA